MAADIHQIAAAARASKVYEVAQRTPLSPARRLSRELGQRVLIKREDLQPVHSFKLRGAYSKLRALACAGVRHVCAASAGNHAQGVALAATTLGLEATIFMPVTTPAIKVEAVRELGATVHLEGDGYDQAQATCERFVERCGNVVAVHPFDDPEVICGQATVGTEIVEHFSAQQRSPDAVFVPVGGGGLIAGVGAAIKAAYPHTRIIGVECDEAPGLSAALEAGRPVEINARGGFADGIAVRRIGAQTFALAREVVDEVVLVTTDQICAAVRDVFIDLRAVLEPAGAAAMAGMRHYRTDRRGETWIGIASGANVNFDRLGHIVESAELGADNEVLLGGEIPERPGEFLKFIRAIGHHAVTEFNYRYHDPMIAQVLVGLKVSADDAARVRQSLAQAHYPVRDFSHNPMARNHLRHLMGGRPALPLPERIFAFWFPERPGALADFLTALAGRWNISLFHYRNHGASYGQVLVAFMVNRDDPEFGAFMAAVGYDWVEETSNPVYQLYLSGRDARPTSIHTSCEVA